MLIRDILSSSKTTFSFEFFPPKNPDAWERLFLTIADLRALKPSWVSVTYGAGGSTRENTHNIVGVFSGGSAGPVGYTHP